MLHAALALLSNLSPCLACVFMHVLCTLAVLSRQGVATGADATHHPVQQPTLHLERTTAELPCMKKPIFSVHIKNFNVVLLKKSHNYIFVGSECSLIERDFFWNTYLGSSQG